MKFHLMQWYNTDKPYHIVSDQKKLPFCPSVEKVFEVLSFILWYIYFQIKYLLTVMLVDEGSSDVEDESSN